MPLKVTVTAEGYQPTVVTLLEEDVIASKPEPTYIDSIAVCVLTERLSIEGKRDCPIIKFTRSRGGVSATIMRPLIDGLITPRDELEAELRSLSISIRDVQLWTPGKYERLATTISDECVVTKISNFFGRFADDQALIRCMKQERLIRKEINLACSKYEDCQWNLYLVGGYGRDSTLLLFNKCPPLTPTLVVTADVDTKDVFISAFNDYNKHHPEILYRFDFGPVSALPMSPEAST